MPDIEKAKRLYREAYTSLNPKSTAVDVVRAVAARQDALAAGVTVREIQEIENDVNTAPQDSRRG